MSENQAPQSSATPAPTDSEQQSVPARAIDENTDLSTLTDEEIRRLNEEALNNAQQVQDERVSSLERRRKIHSASVH
jgi:hypothetical protein